jgi:hypothetical protein
VEGRRACRRDWRWLVVGGGGGLVEAHDAT